MIRTLAQEVRLSGQIAEIDKLIGNRFRDHELADVIASMPGIGPLLGAEFLAATGGGMARFASADHLASFAGLAPAPTGLRRRQRQPPPPPAVSPRAPARLLHLRAHQHP